MVASGMGKRFQDWDIEQAWLFPPSVLDLVPESHPAHFVRELVRSQLDLSAIHADYVEGSEDSCCGASRTCETNGAWCARRTTC